jgi:hypothetical protein
MTAPLIDARRMTAKEFFEWIGVPYRQVRERIVVDDMDISSRNILHLPDLRKVTVRGNFNCSQNSLQTLEGCPRDIRKDFNCSNNHLVSLHGGPRRVGQDFYCDDNRLRSLVGGPTDVRFHFFAAGNRLVTLEGLPALRKLKGIYCPENPLKHLRGLPVTFGEFQCDEGWFTPRTIENWTPRSRQRKQARNSPIIPL